MRSKKHVYCTADCLSNVEPDGFDVDNIAFGCSTLRAGVREFDTTRVVGG